MAQENVGAKSAAYRVAYRSVPQFSRDYARMFGSLPIKDLQRLRSVAATVSR